MFDGFEGEGLRDGFVVWGMVVGRWMLWGSFEKRARGEALWRNQVQIMRGFCDMVHVMPLKEIICWIILSVLAEEKFGMSLRRRHSL